MIWSGIAPTNILHPAGLVTQCFYIYEQVGSTSHLCQGRESNMDTFRRIRSRRRTKGQADAFTTFADAESSYRSSSSAWQTSTTRSSATYPRPSDVTAEQKVNHDQLKQPKSPAEYWRPGSSSRVQPMLIGISRPSITNSRPGTTESIQKAVDRAAESVKHPQTQGTSSPISQVGLRAGRYLDIFAISGQTSKPTRTFNEDVAERNLDVVAPTTEEQNYQYKPTSKYQEEVAARNAHQIAAQRASSKSRPNTGDRVQPIEDRSASAQSGSYVHQSLLKPDVTRSRNDQDPAAYHSRQHSSRTRDAPQQLPAIPQERSSEDFGLVIEKDLDKVRTAERKLEKAKARWLEARQQYRDDSPPDMDKPLPASPRQKDLSRHLGIPPYANAAQLTPDRADSKPTRKSKHDGVQGSAHEDDRRSSRPVQRPTPNDPAPRQAMHASQSQRRDRANDVQGSVHEKYRGSSRPVERTLSNDPAPRQNKHTIQGQRQAQVTDDSRHSEKLQPQSNNSNPAYKRLLVGNRTIMDLTGEDEVTAATPVSCLPMSALEDDLPDASQNVVPAVVEHSPPQESSDAEVDKLDSHQSSGSEPVLDLDQLIRRSQVLAETARAAAGAQSQHVRAQVKERSKISPPPVLAFSPIKTLTSSSPPTTIAFSPISTLSSTSPRSSQDILVEQISAREPGLRSHDAVAPRQTQGEEPHELLTYSDSRSAARVSANIAPLVRVVADVKPEDSEATRSSGSGRPRPTRTDSDHRKGKEIKVSSKKEGKRRETSAEAQIRRAAKSIVPAGPIDQEPLPGVKTRDFAMVPIDKPTNKRIEALVEKNRAQIESKKLSKEPSSSSKSSSSEKKTRGRSARSTNKVAFNDNPVSSATLPQKPERKTEKKSSKKSAKSKSISTRKVRPVSLFDEAAFEKKHAEANAALLRLQQSLQQPVDTGHSVTTRDTVIPGSRALSPVDSVVRGFSPVPQASPAVAAIAMISAATSSPRNQARPLHDKISSESGQKVRNTNSAPVLQPKTEEQLPAVKNTLLIAKNPVLARIDSSNPPPPSPGEVSLSSFPIPTPRAMSPESTKSPPAYVKDVGAPVRRGSQASRVSSASAFSIPFTMVPDRIGSLPENRMGVPGPSTAPRIESIDSIIPPTRPVEVGSP